MKDFFPVSLLQTGGGGGGGNHNVILHPAEGEEGRGREFLRSNRCKNSNKPVGGSSA